LLFKIFKRNIACKKGIKKEEKLVQGTQREVSLALFRRLYVKHGNFFVDDAP